MDDGVDAFELVSGDDLTQMHRPRGEALLLGWDGLARGAGNRQRSLVRAAPFSVDGSIFLDDQNSCRSLR